MLSLHQSESLMDKGFQKTENADIRNCTKNLLYNM